MIWKKVLEASVTIFTSLTCYRPDKIKIFDSAKMFQLEIILDVFTEFLIYSSIRVDELFRWSSLSVVNWITLNQSKGLKCIYLLAVLQYCSNVSRSSLVQGIWIIRKLCWYVKWLLKERSRMHNRKRCKSPGDLENKLEQHFYHSTNWSLMNQITSSKVCLKLEI